MRRAAFGSLVALDLDVSVRADWLYNLGDET
jgi:hypothetical protein